MRPGARWRLIAVLGGALAVLATTGVAQAAPYGESLCVERPFMCIDPARSIGPNGAYTGHDEPSVQFTSNRPGTGGADLTYTVTLPRNPTQRPRQDGRGATWDFQLRATFWLGLTMCDTESFPNFTDTCTPNSDANAAFRSADPASPNYIGRSPGSAFMELQFYEPGWVPQFDGFGCTATQWCANLTIDSLSDNGNTGVPQNADCLNNHFLVGEEPVNWAYITRDGVAQAPANPLALSDDPNLTGLNPDPAKDLLMNPGDTIRVFMHDTPDGYRVDLTDLTTGQTGSMTASVANGFGHILYEPDATTCHEEPFAFHPMYDTAVDRGTTWSAHTSNVAFSDEIGHFELCDAVDATGACTDPGANDNKLDDDDQACLDGGLFGALVPLIACVLDDGDFDGPSYQRDWPGTLRPPGRDAALHPTPVQFTPPTSGGRALERVAFETDLPRIERGEPAGARKECDALTGAHCVNPPPGARFYPFFTAARVGGRCVLQQGGADIPGTFNTFGGSSRAEYGNVPLFVLFPDVGFQPVSLAEDFHRDLGGNPCAGG